MSDALNPFDAAEKILKDVADSSRPGPSERERWAVDKFLELGRSRPLPRAQSVTVPIKVDRAELARIVEQVAQSFPVAKVRKLKVAKHVCPTYETSRDTQLVQLRAEHVMLGDQLKSATTKLDEAHTRRRELSAEIQRLNKVLRKRTRERDTACGTAMRVPRRFVAGWGEITLEQAAEAMRKLVADIGTVREQRDLVTKHRDELDRKLTECRLQRDEAREALATKMTEYRDNCLHNASDSERRRAAAQQAVERTVIERDEAERKLVDEIRTRQALAAEYDRLESELDATKSRYESCKLDRDLYLKQRDEHLAERVQLAGDRDQLRSKLDNIRTTLEGDQ